MTDDLPPGWAWAQLQDLAAAEPRAITDGPFGSNLKTAHYADDGPRVIRLQNIGDGVFKPEEAHISQEHYESLLRHAAQAGDLIVASLGEVLPRACLVPDWVPPAIVKADCIRVRLHSGVIPAYVNFALQLPRLRQATAAKIKGVGRPRLGMQRIRELPIPLAPRAEQERIVAAIGEHFSRLDAAEASIADAEAKCAALPSIAMSRFFSPKWPKCRLDTVAQVGSGATPKRSDTEYWSHGTIPWVTSGAVNQTSIWSADEFISERALAETSVKLWPTGTVLMAMYGEGKTRGKAAVLEFESTCNQACAAINYDRSILDGRFLRTFLNVQYEANRRLSSGGVQPNLNLGLVKAMEVPVPSLQTQASVAMQAEEIVSASVELLAACMTARRRVSALRRSVLVEAFAGRLVPPDPANEPVGASLRRSSSEKSTR